MPRRETHTGGRDATDAVVPGEFALSIGRPPLVPPVGYQWRKLTDLARLESGHTPSRSRPDFWDGDIPWVGIKDATGNHGLVIRDTLQHVAQLGIDNSSARLLPAGTVCLSRTASVGYVVIMGVPMATSQDFVNWVCGPDLSPEYLRYVLMVEQESVRRFAYGSVHQTLYYPDAKALHVCLPGRREQDAVAAVLGALDDKIAANLRINASVQELTACMFSAAAAGLAQCAAFEDICKVGGGGTPRTSVAEYWEGEVPWVTPTDVTALAGPYIDTTSRWISEAGLAACSSPLYPEGSIFMTSRATIGAFAVASRPMAVNQGFIVVNPHDEGLRWWIFHEMRSRVDEFVTHANGATFLELSRGKFKKLRVRLAEESVMRKFHEDAGALHSVAQTALVESRTLADLRDMLLPQLMSGRLRVKDAEKQVEAVV